MVAHNAALQALRWNTESSFGEVSSSFSNRLHVVGLNVDLTQEMQDVGRAEQYQNAESLPVRGIQGGRISFQLPAHGLGSTAAGAVSLNELATFLGHVIGNSDASSNGGVADGTGTATAFGVDGGSEAFAAGSLCRVGDLNDGLGNGQFGAVSGLSAGTLTLLTALDGIPADGDVVYAPLLVYPFETPTTSTVQSLRFEVISANQCYEAYGCYPMSLSLSGAATGGLPMWSLEFGVSAWAPVSSTFPTATSTESYSPVPTAAGSWFENTVGTATRVKRTVRDVEFNFDLQVVPQMGPGAPRDHQAIIGAVRGKTQVSYSFVTDSEAAGTDTYGDIWNTAENSQVKKHHLYTLSTADGYSVGIYIPNAMMVGNRPTQFVRDGRWHKRMSFRGTTGATTTNDLTASNFRIGLA